MHKLNQIDGSNLDITYKIHGLVMSMDKAAEEFLHKSLAISYNQFMLLLAISHEPGNTQKKVAYFCNLTEAAVSKQIETLRKLSYITREEDKSDRRQHILKLTSIGQQILDQSSKLIEENTTKLFSVLTEAEIQNLNQYLNKLFTSTIENFKTIKNINC